MVEWSTGITLIVLAISFLKQFWGSAMALSLSGSSKFILAVYVSVSRTKLKLCREGKPGGAVDVSVSFSSHCLASQASSLQQPCEISEQKRLQSLMKATLEKLKCLSHCF